MPDDNPFLVVLCLLDYIFLQQQENQAKSLDACMFEHNKKVLRFNEKLGYQYDKQEGELVWMRLTKERYLIARQEFKKLNKYLFIRKN